MSNWCKGVFVTDNHGCEQEEAAVKAFFKFLKDWKPEIRIHGGDCFDLKALRKQADGEEKRASLQLDFQMGTEFLYRLKPTVFLNGNHDQRLWDHAAKNNGPISDLCGQCITQLEKDLKKLNCKVHLPYDKRKGIYTLGHLKAAHGYCLGVNAAREMARTYGTVMFGHNHTSQQVAVEGLETRIGFGSGCLCDLNMDFQRASVKTLAHNHGWFQFITNKRTGDFRVWPVNCVNGEYVAMSGFREY